MGKLWDRITGRDRLLMRIGQQKNEIDGLYRMQRESAATNKRLQTVLDDERLQHKQRVLHLQEELSRKCDSMTTMGMDVAAHRDVIEFYAAAETWEKNRLILADHGKRARDFLEGFDTLMELRAGLQDLRDIDEVADDPVSQS